VEMDNSFVVARSVDESWRVLTDLERITPCMPGAQLTEIEGDEFRGLVKVKVGPIVAKYVGAASFRTLDEEGLVAVIDASGRDQRQGSANAVITATLRAQGESATVVNLSTDLSLSGKLASFGKGGIEDVAANVLGQFAANLEAMLADETADTAPGTDAVLPETRVRGIDSAEPEPMDLAAVAAAPMLKRVVPVVIVVALIVGVVLCGLRRRKADCL
jgi:carbon monoxide dehydrogenase subunit G